LRSSARSENVKTIPAGYRAEPLSKFQNKPAPPAAPEIKWPKMIENAIDRCLISDGVGHPVTPSPWTDKAADC
jgi:hypothetical protein